MPGIPLLNKFKKKYSGINGSTYVRACVLHRECAHAHASRHHAHVRVHAYRLYGNTSVNHLRLLGLILYCETIGD
jgi:hypothetical protein